LSSSNIIYIRSAKIVIAILSEAWAFAGLFITAFAFLGNTLSHDKLYTVIIKKLYFKSKSRLSFSAKDSFFGKGKRILIRAKEKIDQQLEICNILM
jgi:hypothetical protein